MMPRAEVAGGIFGQAVWRRRTADVSTTGPLTGDESDERAVAWEHGME